MTPGNSKRKARMPNCREERENLFEETLMVGRPRGDGGRDNGSTAPRRRGTLRSVADRRTDQQLRTGRQRPNFAPVAAKAEARLSGRSDS